MRTRDGRLSHAVEAYFGTGSLKQYQGATTWPSGARSCVVEVSVAPGAFQPLDSDVDWRDRWVELSAMLLPAAYYDAFARGDDPMPGGNADDFMFPTEQSPPITYDVAVLRSDWLYTLLGWDGSSLPRGTLPRSNFAPMFHRSTGKELALYTYADHLTGGLTLVNRTADTYKGILKAFSMEQLGARVTVP